MAGLVSRGLRTICFAKSRKAAELIHRFTVERVDAETARRLAPYRAGYTPQQRRAIEARLVDGELLGVTATNALELGIDIGLLDCAISVGFPGTVASLRQQWGRAGRRSRGLAIMVASDDALDQFFMREPDALLGRRVEAARLDHANPRILDPHVCAAAYEGPITPADADTLGPEALERAALLPELEPTPAGFVWKGRDYPAARTSLRSGSAESFTIVEEETGSVLGLVERERAYAAVHEGAVYLHLGDQYVVRTLDLDAGFAIVVPARVDWYTQAQKETQTAIEATEQTASGLGVALHFGRVSVTEQVIAYHRKAIADGSTLEVVPLVLPEVAFDTEAVWFSPGPALLQGLEEMPKLLGRAPCRGARPDLASAAVGDVRSLGHRWAVDQPALPDGPADRLRLRRPRGRRRHHTARVRVLCGLGRGYGSPARRLSVQRRLPLLRAEPEVREPQRHAGQGSGADAARAHGGELSHPAHGDGACHRAAPPRGRLRGLRAHPPQ